MKIERIRIREEKEEFLFGVVSDTHIPTRAKKLPEKVFNYFCKVDYILHAGDFVSMSAVEELTRMAPTFGVQGNMDFPEILEVFPDVLILKVLNKKIGVYHGSILPFQNERIARTYELNCLITGHTHIPRIKSKKGILFLNPGSPTNPLLTEPSIATLKVTKEKLESRIVYL